MDPHSEDDFMVRSATEAETRGTKKEFNMRTSIELSLLLIMFAMSLSEAPISNLIMYRTCIHTLDYPRNICRSFLQPVRANISQEIEEEVQAYTTFVVTVKSVLEALVPAVLALFMGVWSDKHGRKPLLVWPLFGMTLSSMMKVVYSMMEDLGPWWFVVNSVPYSLSGGFSIMLTGALCYVTDVTSEEYRSFRLMMLETAFAVGMAAGSLASPLLLKLVGNVYLLLIAAALFTAGYAHAAVFIRESVATAVPGNITTVLDISFVKEMFRECFKRRPNRLRAQLLLLAAANSLAMFTLYGISGLGYLYTRVVLNWGLKNYTNYAAATTAISFVGSFLGVAVIQRFLPISDLAFSIVAFLSTASEYLIKGFAAKSWHMYFGSLISFFGGLSSPLIRSQLSKMLPSGDIAKVFALMGAVDGFSPVVAPVLFNALYACTIYSLPGTALLVASGIAGICATLLGIVACIRWNTSSDYQLVEQDEA